MSWLEVLAVIAIIGFVIYQQLAGQVLRAKRVVLLPAILTVIGFLSLRGHHPGPADIIWLTAGAAGSLAIGLAFGLAYHLEARGGVLWGKLPARGLWLWIALIAWRAVIMVIAAHTGAHLAASTTPLLFTLGLNRLGQAAVIMPRAIAAGIPFAPEKDGRTFLSGAFAGQDRAGQDRARQDRARQDRARYDRADYDRHDRDRHDRAASGRY